MRTTLSKSAQRVQAALDQYRLKLVVREFPESTRTAQEAANAIGCQLGQIAKTLVFRCTNSSMPVVVIASGQNRVNENEIRLHTGENIVKGDADFVLKHTGFAIGGVPAIEYPNVKTFIDIDLLTFNVIWAAAGTPHAVFQLTPDELRLLTKGEVVKI